MEIETGFVAEILLGHTLRTVALGAAAMGVVSGIIGAFAVARGQSLLGDAVSHATLPGVVIAAMIFGPREPWALLVGAALAGLAAAAVINHTTNTTPIKFDSSLALVLSTAFGLGMVLLVSQSRSDAAQAGISTFLFGQAAAIVTADLVTIALAGGLVLAVATWRWNDFAALCFDREFAAVAGLKLRRTDIVLVILLVITIAIGLKIVGVILMSAMLVAPAVAARQWSDRFRTVALLSGLIGAIAGVVGSFISSLGGALATGPLVVLTLGAVALCSILLAPAHGILPRKIQQLRQRSRFRREMALTAMLALQIRHPQGNRPHPAAAIEAGSPGHGRLSGTLRELAKAGLASGSPSQGWRLTANGLASARALVAERNLPAWMLDS